MISGSPLFRGRDNQDQLLHIMRIIGTPSDAQFQKLAKEAVSSVPFMTRELLTLELVARNSTQAVSEICKDAISTSIAQSITSG